MYETSLAVERLQAARAAIDAIDPSVMLVGRNENFRVPGMSAAESITRAVAYSEAGADCLFVPFVLDPGAVAERQPRSAGLRGFDPGQVFFTHLTSDVLAGKAAHLQLLHDRALGDGGPHVFDVLVDDVVRAERLDDLGQLTPVRDQLPPGGHVDAVDVRVTHRRRRRGEGDLVGAGYARHL